MNANETELTRRDSIKLAGAAAVGLPMATVSSPRPRNRPLLSRPRRP